MSKRLRKFPFHAGFCDEEAVAEEVAEERVEEEVAEEVWAKNPDPKPSSDPGDWGTRASFRRWFGARGKGEFASDDVVMRGGASLATNPKLGDGVLDIFT